MTTGKILHEIQVGGVPEIIGRIDWRVSTFSGLDISTLYSALLGRDLAGKDAYAWAKDQLGLEVA